MGAPVTKLWQDVFDFMTTLIFAPAQRFHTPTDYMTYIRRAASEYASKIGGLHLVDTTNFTVGSQAAYNVSAQHKKIRKAYYVQSINTPQEIVTKMEVIDEDNAEFISQISGVGNPNNPYGFSLGGSAVAVPKFIVTRLPEENVIILKDPPLNTGDTLKLYTLSAPTDFVSNITWDGDEQDINAIAYLACSLARLKSRDTGEHSIFDSKYQAVVDAYKKARSKANQIKQGIDGRFQNSYTKSINGAL